MNPYGPKSIVSPSSEMLSVFSTPCMNPYACQRAKVTALRLATSRMSRSAHGGRSPPSSAPLTTSFQP